MKLAEALIERRDLQNKLHELKVALTNSALIEEGDQLDISIDELLAQYHQVNQQLSELVVKINVRNQEIKIAGGSESLQEILERRENLRREHGLYSELIEATRDNQRYGHNEIRRLRMVNLKELTVQLDRVAKSIREVDGIIQQTNWLSDL